VALRRPLLENGQTYFALAEFVTYNNVAPWPPVAVGLGASLSRRASQQYANDVASWVATRPSPGFAVPPTAQSTLLQLDQPISASVGTDGTHVRGSTDVDLYSFQPQRDGNFVFQVVGDGTVSATPMLRLLASDGTELARATPDGLNGAHRIQWPLLAGSSYWLVVNGMTDQPIADLPLAGTGLFVGKTGTYELTAQVAEITSGPLHNAALPVDTNADGTVSPLDAILVINELNEASSGT